jgi:formylglycine-generating enzyme required for sulfatase activity
MRTVMSRRIGLAGGAAVLGLMAATLLGGCAGDSDGSLATPTATASPVPPTATPTPTATIAAVSYELVSVGDAGNRDDTTGYGAVPYTYRIGTYEVTIGQYAAFLNAVAANDRYGLYKPGMGGAANIAGITQSGSSGAHTYNVIGPAGVAPPGASSGPDRPITYISWFNAARFANWMANGQPRGAQDETTTEDGAYQLDGANSGDAVARNTINPNTGAPPTFYIPTENEWYKAAYYDPVRDGGAGGYSNFATGSDATPGNVLGDASNQVNYIDDSTGASVYAVTQASNLDLNQNYLNDVGAFVANPSAYGSFDQTGNVWEWNDVDATRSPFRVIRGGAWTSTPPYLQSSLRLGYTPDGVNSNSGFRLAAPAVDSAALVIPQVAPTPRAAVVTNAATFPSRQPRPDAAAPEAAPAVTIELLPVGNPGNADDSTGFGGVAYEFAIAKYDVTIGQYTAFLNAVAATDEHELYNPLMATDTAIAGIARAGEPGAFTYRVLDNGGDSSDRPITYVSWWDAARFANWMANGQPSGAQDETTTEDGAYPVDGATDGEAVARNPLNPNTGAPPSFHLPLEDEWYKAAYYSPARDGGAGGYYDYATQSDTAPGNTIGDGDNQANYFANGVFAVSGDPAQVPNQNYLTDVGAFTNSPSYYGSFDQNGNVWQWNDLDGTPSPSRGLRGGYWFSGSLPLQAALFCNDTTARENNDVGFRLGGPAIE